MMGTLPKQWRHWCRSNKLFAMGRRKNARKSYEWMYLIGRGFVWRLNMHGQLQRGDSIGTFDRWALCSPIYEQPMPTTHAEFSQFVRGALLATQAAPAAASTKESA